MFFRISETAYRRLIKLVSKCAEELVSNHHLRECKALSALKKKVISKKRVFVVFLVFCQIGPSSTFNYLLVRKHIFINILVS